VLVPSAVLSLVSVLVPVLVLVPVPSLVPVPVLVSDPGSTAVVLVPEVSPVLVETSLVVLVGPPLVVLVGTSSVVLVGPPLVVLVGTSSVVLVGSGPPVVARPPVPVSSVCAGGPLHATASAAQLVQLLRPPTTILLVMRRHEQATCHAPPVSPGRPRPPHGGTVPLVPLAALPQKREHSRAVRHAQPDDPGWRGHPTACDPAAMLRPEVCALCLCLLGLSATARADDLPDPGHVRRVPQRPTSPDDLKVPVQEDPPEIVKTEPALPTRSEPVKTTEPALAKTEPTPPVKTTEPAKTEPAHPAKTADAGGCHVDGSAGAWPLLALVGLGLRRRR
jgi:MYXO-CTERM domain-containing protein